MIFDNNFVCTVTGKSHKRLFIYRFHSQKSDMETKGERCDTARHFNSKCYNDTNPFQ